MPAVPEMVRGGFLRGVEVFDLQVAAPDEVVIRARDARDGGQEDRVRGEVGGEIVGAAEELPGTHDEPDEGADVAAAPDVEVAREEGRHVRPGRDGVGGDVGAELGEGEGGRDEEDAGAVTWCGLVEEGLQEGEGVPDRGAEDDGRGGGDDYPDEGGHAESDGDGEELGPECIGGVFGETGEVRVADYEGSEVSDSGHDAEDYSPC